jgi:hypothetical protein
MSASKRRKSRNKEKTASSEAAFSLIQKSCFAVKWKTDESASLFMPLIAALFVSSSVFCLL